METVNPSAREGSITLERMDSATNYNAWLGRKFSEHLGQRVLEIGAGTGTITEQIAPGRDLVMALEIEDLYVQKLRARFEGNPRIRPILSDVALADWPAFKKEGIDSILLSNVLEHIPDDAGAVRRFHEILAPDGKLVIFVPALQQLFGALDEAVGHYRRYTPSALRALLEENGFVVRKLEWMNLLGIPGWFLNSRLLRRRTMPPFQLRMYDFVAPVLAQLESRVRVPIGLSLFAVAEAVPQAARS